MKYLSIVPALLTLFVLGCVSTNPQQSNTPPPGQPLPERLSMPTVQKKLQAPPEGTIYSASKSKNIYQDTRARDIGDIVMVKIVETSSGSTDAETTTSRDATLQGGVSSLFGYEKLFSGTNGHIPSLASMNANLAKSFTGTGETTRDSTVTATLSARVIDITMDGNLAIRGYREVRVNNETQHIILSGIIRPEDISKDNSVLSSYIADARIEYNGSGVVSDKQQPGWLANLVDVVWPF
jgi:flagellar L-ring protein precursor FlgH